MFNHQMHSFKLEHFLHLSQFKYTATVSLVVVEYCNGYKGLRNEILIVGPQNPSSPFFIQHASNGSNGTGQ